MKKLLKSLLMVLFCLTLPDAFDLNGLEHLYFIKLQRSYLNDSNNQNQLAYNPACVKKYLPQKSNFNYQYEKVISNEYNQEIIIKDFILNIDKLHKGNLFIRQIYDVSHPKIFKTYWSIYENKNRQSIWFYTPFQKQNDFAISLANINIDTVLQINDSLVQIIVKGKQFRNGYWVMRSTTLNFSLDSDSLNYTNAINNFCFMEGESFEIYTEKECPDIILTKRVINPNNDLLKKCGYESPLISDSLTWQDYSIIADKITADSIASQTYRKKTDKTVFEK